MSFVLALFAMVLIHILDDFGLQHFTHLNELKQKTWWIEQCYVAKKYNNVDTSIYKYDYIICLMLHAFEWSCMTVIPTLCIFGLPSVWTLVLVVLVNTAVHAFIDDLKANKLKINLVTDQLCHIVQILLMLLCFMWHTTS